MNDIIDTIYFKTISHFYLGQYKEAKQFFKHLESLYDNNKKESLEYFNKYPHRYYELLDVKKQLIDGKIVHNIIEDFEPYENEIQYGNTELEKEWELVKLICKNLHTLKPFLGKNIKVKSIEHETYQSDRCDVVIMNNDEKILYPIELKLNKATHAIVGQIDKYCIHFKSQLIKKMYEKVKGVTIANSYSPYAINELLKKDIICLIYTYDSNFFNIEKIKSKTI